MRTPPVAGFVEATRALPAFHEPSGFALNIVLAGRPKDLEDVRGLLLERLPELDIQAIRTTLALVEAALGQSDLTPAFEAELERVQHMRRLR